QFTAIVNKHLQPRRVIDQEAAKHHFVEDRRSRGLLEFHLPKLRQQLHRTGARIDVDPVAAPARQWKTGGQRDKRRTDNQARKDSRGNISSVLSLDGRNWP